MSTFPPRVLLPLLLFARATLASAPAVPPALPTDEACRPLPTPVSPFSFFQGELLEFDIDALGAVAGQMRMRTLSTRKGEVPVEITVQTNTFFSKVRRVKGLAQSFLHRQTLRPARYLEKTVENEVPKSAQVVFLPDKSVQLKYTVAQKSGERTLRYANEGLDVAGAIYLMRQLPLEENLPLCFDAYAIRRMWRVVGRVLGKEKVSLPLGEFDAWHIAGEAVRLDELTSRREVHVWISADGRRLPLAAVGMIDLGAVRATLKAVHRPGDKSWRAQGKETLKW